MVDFTDSVRLEVQTSRSDAFTWGISTWTGYRFGGLESGTEWMNVLGQSHSISVRRGGKKAGIGIEIEAGSLQATVLDPSVDPSSNPYIKPGTPIRLMHNDESVFTGELRQVQVTYRKGQPRIVFSAVDAVKDLANTMRYGVAAGEDYPSRVTALLSKHRFDYQVFGAPTATLALNDHQSDLLKHMTLATNSEQGRWYVDRNNTIKAFTKSAPYGPKTYTFTDKRSTGPEEIEYVDIGVAYDSAELVNEINVNNWTRVWNTENGVWDSVETKHGPYRNNTSIATYGAYKADLDTNLWNHEVDAFAASLMNRSGQPHLHVSNVRANMSDAPHTAATFDIYDTVGIEYSSEHVHIGDDYQVIAVSHEITAHNNEHKWMTTLELKGGI